MTELVHLDVTAGVATITLDSPHNRNALSSQLRQELLAHLDDAIADDGARVILLTHTGAVFCAGMDLKEARGAGARHQGVNEFPAILERIWTSPTPVLARLTGPARAGGVGLVAACDIAVAAEDATFAFSEVRIGVVPAIISVTVLPRLLPASGARAVPHRRDLRRPHRRADRAAQQRGARLRLDVEVARYVDMLRLGAPGALAATKELLRRERPARMGDEFAEMLELSAGFFAGDEGQEGMRAFAEKRPPGWAVPPG